MAKLRYGAKRYKKDSFRTSMKGFLVISGCVIVAFVLKIGLIGVDEPKPEDGTVKNVLVGALAPTPIPESELKLQKANEELEKTRREVSGLRAELVSRGEVIREEARIVGVFNKFLNGRLKNKGVIIHRYAKENYISTSLVVAIIIQELGNECDSNVFRNANNPCGMNWNKERYAKYPKYGRYVKFPDVDTGLMEMCKLLNECYVSIGKNDIASIGAKWAPIDDYQQGMYGMDNTTWPQHVTRNYNMIMQAIKEQR